MARRRRCQGPCGELHDPGALAKLGKRWLCEECMVQLADEAIAAADGEPPSGDGDSPAPPFATPEQAADAVVDAIRDRRGEDAVTMYATPGVGDGTPVTVPFDEIRERLLEGFAILPAEARRAGITDLRRFATDTSRTTSGGETWTAGTTTMTLPAPTVQPDAPMPDLRDEDEKEREWDELPDVQVPGWPLRRGRLSASALGCFARCPEQFRYKYVLGQRDPDSGASITGRAVHKAIARNWLYKMAQGEDAPLTMIEATYDHAFDVNTEREEEKAGAVAWGHDGTQAKRPMTMDAWRGRGKEALGGYMLQIAPGVWPRAAEDLFVIQVAGLVVPVVGFIDVVTDRAMIDLKFGAKKQGAISPEWRIQGLTYLLSQDRAMEYHSLNWKGEFRTPADSPGLVMRRTAEAYAIAGDLVRSMVSGILAYAERFGVDRPWPGAVTHTWACSTCAFEPDCHWWHRPYTFDLGGPL